MSASAGPSRAMNCAPASVGATLPRRPRQQTNADLLFQPPNGVTQGRGRNAEPPCGPRKAALLRHGQERRENAELVAYH